MTDIWAKPILKSYCPTSATEIFTVLCRYPRWIHSELMTHRAFSRNAASSRARPVKKLCEEALDNPAKPIYWTKEQKGMSGGEPLHEEDQDLCEKMWLDARDNAVRVATYMASMGVHKSLPNRLLEPFTHIEVLITATEWANFFELRCHPDAEPHIQQLAECIGIAKDSSPAQRLDPGQWHVPFVGTLNPTPADMTRAVACCASTSYDTVEGEAMTIERADKIFKKLTSKPLHASPFEHIAQADQPYDGGFLRPGLHRNFRGWKQLRALIEREEYVFLWPAST